MHGASDNSEKEVVQFLSGRLPHRYITLPPGGSDAVAAGEGVFEGVERVIR